MTPRRSTLVCALALSLFALPSPPTAAARGPVDTMVASVNSARASRGLPALRPSRTLMRSTRRYSRTLASRGLFVHSRLAHVGRFRRVGEALAKHSGRRAAAYASFRMLMSSPPHRRLLLSRSMRQIGAGYAFGGGSAVWVVQVGRR